MSGPLEFLVNIYSVAGEFSGYNYPFRVVVTFAHSHLIHLKLDCDYFLSML